MSCCELFREVDRAASVLARPRKKGDEEGGEPNGEGGEAVKP
jgi:hypothetical protein